MAWFLVFPLSLLAGPAGLAVALVAFLGWSKRDRFQRGPRPFSFNDIYMAAQFLPDSAFDTKDDNHA